MKIIRSSTIPLSLNIFYKGFLKELKDEGYEVVALSSPGNDLEEINQREGVKTIAVSMERRISPFKDFKSLFSLIKVFKKEKPDIIHSITPKAGLLSMIAGWVCRVPIRIHTFTGLVFPTSTGIKKKLLILTDKLTCACATHINPEGEGVRNDLIKFKITKKPLTILGHGNIKGIDLDYFNPNLEELGYIKENKSSQPFTFCFVGRLVREKGINELVSAFKKLNNTYPDTQLILVGNKEQEIDPIKPETLNEIESNPAIKAVGPQKDIRPFLMSADLFVFPSYREGFPNVVIEAGAMNLPSIVSDINGCNEIIIPNENGVIIPSKNEDALFISMEDLYNNPDKVKKMAEKSRHLVSSRFEQSYVRKCLKDYYKDIVKNQLQ